MRRLIASEGEALCYSESDGGVMIIQIRNNLRHQSPACRTLVPFLIFSCFPSRQDVREAFHQPDALNSDDSLSKSKFHSWGFILQAGGAQHSSSFNPHIVLSFEQDAGLKA